MRLPVALLLALAACGGTDTSSAVERPKAEMRTTYGPIDAHPVLPGDGLLHLALLAPDGQRAAGATIMAMTPDGQNQHAFTTDGEGQCWQELAPGAYAITITFDNAQTKLAGIKLMPDQQTHVALKMAERTATPRVPATPQRD